MLKVVVEKGRLFEELNVLWPGFHDMDQQFVSVGGDYRDGFE